MRNVVIGCLVLFTMAGTAFGEEPKQPPKELAVDLGKGVKLEMVLIPAGEFLMGSPDSDTDAETNEKPQHRVRITKPFYLGKYLVTQEQWEVVMGNNPSEFKGPKNPVEQVTWDDCQKFLDKLNAKVARRRKVPVADRAQWEYACRAGSKTRYCFGDDESKLGDYAWYGKNSDNKTHPVGEKKPNAWGLYDMHGNVLEWCQDWWKDGYYNESPVDDPTGPATGAIRMDRGGSWSTRRGTAGRRTARTACLGSRATAWVCVSPEFRRQPPQSPEPTETKQITNSIGMKLTLVPSGEFMMGSSESAEETAAFFNKTYGDGSSDGRRFSRTSIRSTACGSRKPFYLGTYHVTRGQFRQFVADTQLQDGRGEGREAGGLWLEP